MAIYNNLKVVPLTADKRPNMAGSWKDSNYKYEDIKNMQNAGVIIPAGFVVCDFDDEANAKKAIEIITALKLRTIITKTTRGCHIWFKLPKNNINNIVSQVTDTQTLCGLRVDLRINSYLMVKQNGKVRDFVYKNVDSLEEVIEIPFIFWPNKTGSQDRYDLLGLRNGSRTNTLHSYFCHLQNYKLLWGFPRETRKKIIINSLVIINKFLLEEPLTDSELFKEVLHNGEVNEPNEEIKFEAKEEAPVFAASEINTNKIAEELTAKFRIKNYNGELFHYNDGYYQNYGSLTKLKKAIYELYPSLSNFQIREIVERIQLIGYIEKINENPEVLNLANGRYHTRLHIFVGHDSDAIETQRIPVNYEENITSNEQIDKYRLELFGSQEMVNLIDEITGYIFLRNLSAQKLFVFWGGAGSGKSTYLNIIKNLVGDENRSSVSLVNMTENKYANSLMVNKLLNTIDEVDSTKTLKSADNVKILSCGQDLYVEQKYREGFNTKIYATQIIALNDPIKIHDEALMDRLLIVPFFNRYRNTSRQINENKIYDFTCSEAGKSYLFGKAMEGLQKLQNNNFKFTVVKEVEDAKKLFIDDDVADDDVAKFLEDFGINEDNITEFGTTNGITEVYRGWCIINKKVFIGSTKFKNRVEEILNVEIKKVRINGTRDSRFVAL